MDNIRTSQGPSGRGAPIIETDYELFATINPDTETCEWNRAWRRIEREFGNSKCFSTKSGSEWRYTGSYLDGDFWQHQFRQRASDSDDLSYFHFRASRAWKLNRITALQQQSLQPPDMRLGDGSEDGNH
jgi:hypothetical protein